MHRSTSGVVVLRMGAVFRLKVNAYVEFVWPIGVVRQGCGDLGVRRYRFVYGMYGVYALG